MSRLFGSPRAMTTKPAALLFSCSSSHHFIIRNIRAGYVSYQGRRPLAKCPQGRVSQSPYSHRGRRYSTVPEKLSDPLHILFCGSDDFSCASLRALHDEHVANPDLIRSIDVVVRPGKPTGRGYKVIRHPPLRSLASSLGLQIHERDTFTGWDMPSKTNLIIAVSFGLFVPPRLLHAAKYGGLNLHPSLLPDLRGPAPLQHALLAGRALTGVSLQTLDDRAFDHGVVLSQTPSDASHPDALRVPPGCATVAALQSLVTPAATRMLVGALRAGLHVPPLRDVGWTPQTTSLRHAPKITKRDRRLTAALLRASDRETSDPAPEIETRARGVLARYHAAIGPLWFVSRDRRGARKRIIVDALEEMSPGLSPAHRPGVIEVAAADTSAPIPPSLSLQEHRPRRTAHGYTRYLIPFEGDPEEGGVAGGAQEQDGELEQRGEPALNLVFWDRASEGGSEDTSGGEEGKEEKEEDTALYLGNYRVLRLKVEGEKAKPARLALHRFFIS
ncbi:formyl transferase [Nemania sp. NC0429]|nr:formyl transferase [Nemania sp. NC0429]